jgi:glycosyltransferase involved in cell wall biosynthesis
MSARELRPRVLMVAPSLRILGGQAVQAKALLDRLRATEAIEIEFLPVNPHLPGVFGRLQEIKYVRTVLTSAAYIASLLTRMRGYDVIHIFSASYFSFILAATPAILVARMYGKATILNYRSGEAEDHLQRWPSAIRTIRLVDRIVAPSGYLVDVFGRFGFHAQSIFNIVDTKRFSFRKRKPWRPLFLSNRNLEPMYNVGCILRAFAIIQLEYSDAELTLAGDGSERPRLEALAQELRLRNVRWLGRVDHRRMNELYDAADIYLNSPDIDNMPGSIIEAYASGIPVVTTDAGGIPYIVRHQETGLLVPRGDFEALASGALRYLRDPELAEAIAARAREECQQYTWDAVRDQWMALYTELAKIHSRKSIE